MGTELQPKKMYVREIPKSKIKRLFQFIFKKYKWIEVQGTKNITML